MQLINKTTLNDFRELENERTVCRQYGTQCKDKQADTPNRVCCSHVNLSKIWRKLKTLSRAMRFAGFTPHLQQNNNYEQLPVKLECFSYNDNARSK